jgi:Arc/MetJ family transcription regulator
LRTTLVIDENLLNEVKVLTGSKTKKQAVEKALKEFVQRRKAKALLDLEGKVELSLSVTELIERRHKDVSHR